MRALLEVLARVIVAALRFWREQKSAERTDAVRTDPAGEWVRKFGGVDKRDASPSSDDPRSGGN